MHERGEQLPIDDPYQQNLQTVLGIIGRFKDPQYPTYAQLSWPEDQETIEKITTREVINAEYEPHPNIDYLPGTYNLTVRKWSSDTPKSEPTIEIVQARRYRPKHSLTMGDFTGYPVTASGLLKPFFNEERCNSKERQRLLITALTDPVTSGDHKLTKLIMRFRDSIFKNYGPDDIDHYLRITEDLEELPAPFARSNIAQHATRRMINDLAPRTGTKSDHVRLSDAEIRVAVLKLEQTDLLDDSFFTSPYAYTNPVFSEVLHKRLQSDRREATLRALNRDPYTFAQEYMGTILSLHATNPDRHTRNARVAIADTRESPLRTHVSPTKIIEVANTITQRRNSHQDQAHQLPQFRSIHSLGNVGEAFFRVLNITRQPNTEHTDTDIATDRMHAEIVEMILESVIRRELGRRVITIAELAERYPEASDEEFAILRDALQNGTPYNKLSKIYAELIEQRKQK